MKNPKFIFVIGFMASGKSTFGKRIAKELEYNFVDTDNYIEQKEGKSIPDIFNQYGEKYFRILEKYALNEILERDSNTVISTGGGMSCNQHRLNKMLKNGKVVYLDIDPKSVINRLKNAKQKRPLLSDLSDIELEEKINQLLKKRKKYYGQAPFKVSSMDAKKASLDFLV